MNNIIDVLSGKVNTSKKERVMSVAAGITLIAAGILSRKWKAAPSITEIVAGTALLLRGASGYCPVNDLIGRNTAADDLAEDAEQTLEELE